MCRLPRRSGTMGDGNFIHTRKTRLKSAVRIVIAKTSKRRLRPLISMPRARKITALRDFLQQGSSYAVSQKARRPIVNVQKLPEGEIKLVSRLDRQVGTI